MPSLGRGAEGSAPLFTTPHAMDMEFGGARGGGRRIAPGREDLARAIPEGKSRAD